MVRGVRKRSCLQCSLAALALLASSKATHEGVVHVLPLARCGGILGSCSVAHVLTNTTVSTIHILVFYCPACGLDSMHEWCMVRYA